MPDRSPMGASSATAFRALVHRHRLAGEGCLVDAQVFHAHQAQVGRHPGARLQQHDIARHQQGGVDLVPLALAQYRGVTGQHGAHRFQRLLRLAFLNETDNSVDQHHADNHACIHIVLKRNCDGARNQQHIDQRDCETAGQNAAKARVALALAGCWDRIARDAGRPPRGSGRYRREQTTSAAPHQRAGRARRASDPVLKRVVGSRRFP